MPHGKSRCRIIKVSNADFVVRVHICLAITNLDAYARHVKDVSALRIVLCDPRQVGGLRHATHRKEAVLHRIKIPYLPVEILRAEKLSSGHARHAFRNRRVNEHVPARRAQHRFEKRSNGIHFSKNTLIMVGQYVEKRLPCASFSCGGFLLCSQRPARTSSRRSLAHHHHGRPPDQIRG